MKSTRIIGLAAAISMLAGCGAGSGTASRTGTAGESAAARAVSDAARRTLSMSARVDFTLHGARAFGAARAPVFGKGSFDFRAGDGQEIIDLPEAKHQEHGNEHAIILPSRVYLQPKGTSLPRGKRWVAARIGGSESVHTNFPSFVSQVEGVNPTLALSELALGADSGRAVREELIGHVVAERYRLSVDLARVLSALRGSSSAALGQAIQEVLTSSPTADLDVWIDKKGRVIEFQTGPDGTGDGSALVRLSEFGTKVAVHDPPPSRVVDIGALTPSGERENNGGGDSDGG
jgi:hypothetical protein